MTPTCYHMDSYISPRRNETVHKRYELRPYDRSYRRGVARIGDRNLASLQSAAMLSVSCIARLSPNCCR